MLKPFFRSPSHEHFFSGYYDKSPFNAHNTRHLALRTDFIDRLPSSSDRAEVGYFELDSGEYKSLAATHAFNWQQGAMLQWLGPSHSELMIFNDFDSSRYVAKILAPTGIVESQLQSPIYALRAQGDLALTIDFERHYWCRRAYSYGCTVNPEKDRARVEGDAIHTVHLASGSVEPIVSLNAVLNIEPSRLMEDSVHYLEHMMFSPSGHNFMFYHRWRRSDGSIYTRLFVCSVSHPTPQLLLQSGRVSHACWVDDQTILLWGSPATGLGSIRSSPLFNRLILGWAKPIYKSLVRGNSKFGQTSLSRLANGDSYMHIDVSTGQVRPICQKSLDRDGHPSALSAQGAFVTDTYPDRSHFAKLLLANWKTDSALTIDELESLPELDETPYRCDLHPKVSFCGNLVSVDTLNEGHRSVYAYDIRPMLSELNSKSGHST
jgi:hypothetical protein